MLCDKCKKNSATYFSTVNINGNVTETHLCAECASEVNTFNFNSFFGNSKLDDFGFDNNNLTCKCGYTLSDYIETGLLGCGNCYNTFKDYLVKNLTKFQYGVNHIGKTPADLSENTTENKIRMLELKLKQAVLEENYEEASELKKQIINLKDNSNGNK